MVLTKVFRWFYSSPHVQTVVSTSSFHIFSTSPSFACHQMLARAGCENGGMPQIGISMGKVMRKHQNSGYFSNVSMINR